MTSLVKPLEISFMTYAEYEEIQNYLSNLKIQINELNDREMKNGDLIDSQNGIEWKMEYKMNENKY